MLFSFAQLFSLQLSRGLGRLGIRERPSEVLEQWALATLVLGWVCGVLFRPNERTIELANERR